MRFFVLYYQTIEFTGVYQRWTMYALMPKSVSEMLFHANSKKTQSLGKNSYRQKCLDKSLIRDHMVFFLLLQTDFFQLSSISHGFSSKSEIDFDDLSHDIATNPVAQAPDLKKLTQTPWSKLLSQ